MKRVTYRKAAQKALARMPRNQRDLIQSKIEEYALNPDHLKNNVIKLADRPGYRMRVGDWRIIFEVSDTDMDVIVIGPRGSVYD